MCLAGIMQTDRESSRLAALVFALRAASISFEAKSRAPFHFHPLRPGDRSRVGLQCSLAWSVCFNSAFLGE
jgi:hypothetical protein